MVPTAPPAGDEIYNVVDQVGDESELDKRTTLIECSFQDSTGDRLSYLLDQIQTDYRVYIKTALQESSSSGERGQAPIEKTFSGYFKGDIKEELFAFATANGFAFDVIGNSIFLVERDYKAPIVYSFDANLDEEEVKLLTELFPDAKMQQVRDRLVVQAPFYQIQQIRDLIASGGFAPSSYILSIVLLRTKRDSVKDIQAKIDFEGVDLISKGLSMYDVFSAYGKINWSASIDSVYNEQELYCTSGRPVTFLIGSEIQREQRAISDQGTSTVSDWKVFEDGLTLEATLYDGREDEIFADINFESSKFNDSSDVSKSKTSIEYSRLKVQTGKIYYLCQYADNRKQSNSGFIRLGGSRSDDVISVWFCALPVSAKLDRKKLY